MRKTVIKSMAISLCALMLISSGAAVNAAQAVKEKQTVQATSEAAMSLSESRRASKDETVYVIAGADGSVDKIIVSDWIKNTLKSEKLNDKTELNNIENVKGDAGYTLGGGNTRVWDAKGNDVYYQGSIDKELPVGVAVAYKLDGKEISPENLAGKSGRVTIRFDYYNRQYEYVEIGGQKEKIYVPFAMLTGMFLDNEVFTNVEVSNGKLINDGDRTVVIGLAFPGLQDNLKLSSDKLDIPDYVEITADVTDFELGMTVTLATNEVFNSIDTDKPDSISDISGSLNELTDAMDRLMDGSSKLYDGLSTLLDKSGELVAGIDKLSAGASELKAGAGKLNSGASDLKSGAAQLSAGLDALASNSGTINGGAKQVFKSLLSAANTQLDAAGIKVPTLTIGNYADVLDGVIASLDKTAVYEKALSAVTAAVQAQRPEIERQVTAAVRKEAEAKITGAMQKQITEQVTEAVRADVTKKVIYSVTEMDKASYDEAVAGGLIDEAVKDAVNSAIKEQMQSKAVLQTISSKASEKMESKAVKDMIAEKTEEKMRSDGIKQTIANNVELQVEKAISENMASDEVQAQLAAASEGSKAVIALKASLDSYNAFYLGLKSYTAGVSTAASGASELKSGANELKSGTSALYDGACELYDGVLTLKNGAPALVDGIKQLKDGAMRLSDGLKQFNEEGVQKLVDAAGGDLAELSERLRATVDVSKNYKSFSGIDESMDGNVQFIYKTDSIEQ